tara:strand:+ start:78 stop:1178 length:1101 start_codon:yes stop_codon:yes gene_type:complete
MNNNTITNCLVVLNIILFIVICYDIVYKRREGAIFTGTAAAVTALVATIKASVTQYAIGNLLWILIVPSGFWGWTLFAAGIAADVVPQIVANSKDKGKKRREQTAQLNGINNVSFVRTYREKNDKHYGEAMYKYIKVPSFKCLDKGVLNSECTLFECDRQKDKSGRKIIPPALNDMWFPGENNKMYLKRKQEGKKGLDERYSRLVECYLSTYDSDNQEDDESKRMLMMNEKMNKGFSENQKGQFNTDAITNPHEKKLAELRARKDKRDREAMENMNFSERLKYVANQINAPVTGSDTGSEEYKSSNSQTSSKNNKVIKVNEATEKLEQDVTEKINYLDTHLENRNKVIYEVRDSICKYYPDDPQCK